jgi:hypothetical protein
MYDTPTGEHPDIIRMREREELALATGYTEGDVNHYIQPLIGFLRSRLRDIEEDNSIAPNVLFNAGDLQYYIERMEKACLAELAWIMEQRQNPSPLADHRICNADYGRVSCYCSAERWMTLDQYGEHIEKIAQTQGDGSG